MKLNSLISKAIEHDRVAQKTIVSQFAPYLFAVCKRYLSHADAKDALQDAFVLIFKNLHQFNATEPQFQYWLRRIAVNAALSKIRKSSYKSELYLDTDHLEKTRTPKVIDDLETQDILKLLNLLPEKQKQVFNLYIIDGFKHKEIAVFLEITEQNSKNLLFKARKTMQELILDSEKIRSR